MIAPPCTCDLPMFGGAHDSACPYAVYRWGSFDRGADPDPCMDPYEFCTLSGKCDCVAPLCESNVVPAFVTETDYPDYLGTFRGTEGTCQNVN